MAAEQVSTVATSRLSQRDLALIFYLGWPAFLGAILGWTGAGTIGGQLDRLTAITYWIIGFLVYRLTLEVSIRLIAVLSPKQKTPLILLCILSVPLHLIIGAPLVVLWQSMFIPYLPLGAEVQPGSPFFVSMSQYMAALSGSVMILLEWTLSNYAFDRVLGFPRFRHITGYKEVRHDISNQSKSTPEEFETAPPKFLRRVPGSLGTDVIALSAEDHYVRVYTPLGSDLVLYRFSDAMSEMPAGSGIQVHRSHWVKTSAVTDFQKHEKGQRLTVSNAIKIPVSKRFLELLKANGLEPKSVA
jgi:hypothetical protein